MRLNLLIRVRRAECASVSFGDAFAGSEGWLIRCKVFAGSEQGINKCEYAGKLKSNL